MKSCLLEELTVISSPTLRTFRGSRRSVLLFLGVIALFFAQNASAQRDADIASLFSQFRPRTEVQGIRYIGREVCAKCHARRNSTQSGTAMAHAMQSVSESPVLRSHASLAFKYGRYEYEIIRQGESSLYQVSDGREKIVEPILYSFGQGHAGQTYILRHRGKLYESRVSFYTEIDNLDWTIGYAQNLPKTLEEAIGRSISADEARSCFSCHGTAAIAGNQVVLEKVVPGVGCEACHGPGGRHVTSMQSGTDENLYIFNPKSLDPDTLSQEFCGACHRSASTVEEMPEHAAMNNVRFQPYRIFTSKGHDPNDPHLACTACHDPHQDLQRDEAKYDAKCTVCHEPAHEGTVSSPGNSLNTVTEAESPGPRKAQGLAPRSCPVGRELCVSCHMPKIAVASAHFKFTDHRIRIVRKGQPYPY